MLLRDLDLEVGNIGKAPSCDLASGDGGVRGSVAFRLKGDNGDLPSLIAGFGDSLCDRFVGLPGAKARGR